MKSALLLYPHQLYPVAHLPRVDTVVIMEDPLFFGMDIDRPLKLHKQKMILLRAALRRYVEEVLWPAGYKIEYIDMDVFMKSEDILDRVKKAEQIYVIDPTDERLSKSLLAARRERDDIPNLTFLASPNFYLKEHEVREFFNAEHKQPFGEFYQWQRERFNILIDKDYKPVSGQWVFEAAAKKLGASTQLPSFPVFGDSKHVAEATAWVEEHFPDNPGSTDFIWPTSHAEAATWLEDFVQNRLDDYATYQQTIDPRSPWLFHSLLASSLNIGLLQPDQIVDAVLKRHEQRPVPLESLEMFVRQVLGWREFTRGQYLVQPGASKQNPFDHRRKLTSAWFNGSTGLPPLDDLITKLKQHAYAHQAEQRLIAGNLMLLCEISPTQMYSWFSELSVDTFDWTVSPNVYGLNMFASGDASGVPPITPSSTLLDMSNYERGVWSDVWDGLFWRFVDKHEHVLSKNPHMRPMIGHLHKLDADHRRIIHYRAEDFLNQHTIV